MIKLHLFFGKFDFLDGRPPIKLLNTLRMNPSSFLRAWDIDHARSISRVNLTQLQSSIDSALLNICFALKVVAPMTINFFLLKRGGSNRNVLSRAISYDEELFLLELFA